MQVALVRSGASHFFALTICSSLPKKKITVTKQTQSTKHFSIVIAFAVLFCSRPIAVRLSLCLSSLNVSCFHPLMLPGIALFCLHIGPFPLNLSVKCIARSNSMRCRPFLRNETRKLKVRKRLLKTVYYWYCEPIDIIAVYRAEIFDNFFSLHTVFPRLIALAYKE